MKISKHLHSCLLVEDGGKAVLIDPGMYTVQAKALDLNSIEKLDYVLYTHSHFDHFDAPFLKELVAKFPSVKVVATQDTVDQVKKEGIEVEITTEGNEDIEVKECTHETILNITVPNVLFHIFGKLTHPGDSLQFTESKEVLALPITAPWGHMQQAVEKALEVKPKVAIPIHDFHWKDDARQTLEGFAAQYLKANGGPELRMLETGEVYED